jgi:hypothetical protein
MCAAIKITIWREMGMEYAALLWNDNLSTIL